MALGTELITKRVPDELGGRDEPQLRKTGLNCAR